MSKYALAAAAVIGYLSVAVMIITALPMGMGVGFQ